MSIEDLKADIERNSTDLDTRPISTMDDVKAVIKDTVLALFASVANEMQELDDDLSDLVEHADSILQEEDAALFALVFQGGLQIAEALEKRLKPVGNANDDKWRKKLAQFRQLAQKAAERLVEITVAAVDEDDEEEDAPNDAPPDSPGTAPTLVSVPANDQEAQ